MGSLPFLKISTGRGGGLFPPHSARATLQRSPRPRHFLARATFPCHLERSRHRPASGAAAPREPAGRKGPALARPSRTRPRAPPPKFSRAVTPPRPSPSQPLPPPPPTPPHPLHTLHPPRPPPPLPLPPPPVPQGRAEARRRAPHSPRRHLRHQPFRVPRGRRQQASGAGPARRRRLERAQEALLLPMTDPGRMTRSHPIASRAANPRRSTSHAPISVPVRPSLAVLRHRRARRRAVGQPRIGCRAVLELQVVEAHPSAAGRTAPR